MLERLPRALLRAEGLALCAGTVVLYLHRDYSLLLFVALALAPDLSMLAYLAGPRAGAVAYDALHTSALPVALAVAGVLVEAEFAIQLALVWLAHIGLDRFVGYGLKYPSGFKDTHLNRV